MKGISLSKEDFLKIRSGKQDVCKSTDKVAVNQIAYLIEPIGIGNNGFLYEYERDSRFWETHYPDVVFTENSEETARFFVKIVRSTRVFGTDSGMNMYKYTVRLVERPEAD
ncbi:MAG: hypothetical protein LBC84_09265 [Prevotellaceae bacterium]|jgi:hypothetical protein|nr:hypothetical protein [Prevotellaceae bacterium]